MNTDPEIKKILCLRIYNNSFLRCKYNTIYPYLLTDDIKFSTIVYQEALFATSNKFYNFVEIFQAYYVLSV
jgi:hypothetical protein